MILPYTRFCTTEPWRNPILKWVRHISTFWWCSFDNIYQWMVRAFGTNALLVPVSFKQWNCFYHKTVFLGLYCSKFMKNSKAWILVCVNPAIYFFSINNGSIRIMFEICSQVNKLTIKTTISIGRYHLNSLCYLYR